MALADGGLQEMDAAFYDKVYEVVAQIPPGRVCTYGQLAALAGHPGAAREAGIAMARADGKTLPCHRVVNKTGALSPDAVFGGKEVQRQRLAQEGVTFRADGTINMERHGWPGEAAHEQLSLF